MTVELVLGAIVVVLALAFVVYPLLRPKQRAALEPVRGSESDNPWAARQTIYREMLELEFDHRVGKLDEADFQQLSEDCLARAAALMAESDARRAGADDTVEQEVAALRADLHAAPSEDLERRTA